MTQAEGPLAIIAGSGALPWEAAAAIAPRRQVIVFAIDGEADEGPSGQKSYRLAYGQIGKLLKLLGQEGCSELLFLGAIRARPDFRRIIGDVETLKLAPTIVRAAVGGDDNIVRNVLSIFEDKGFRIVSAGDAVPELLAPAGALGRHTPQESHLADIELGRTFLDAVAAFDIGQAAVVVEGRIIALEGAEGTDAMLARCQTLRENRRVRAVKGAGVLVKRAKRGQDMRADVPVVGAATMEKVIAAGLGGVALEAGRTIVAERAAMLALADRSGAFVIGT